MEYRTLGNSDLKVSVVGLGTWAIGGDFWGTVDDKESIRSIQAAIDAGVTLVDTAPAYGGGHSEEVVGQAIRGRRDKVVVATKVGIIRTEDDFIRNLKPESIRREVDDSLRRLGVDTIDLWQIHWPDAATPLEDTLAELVRIKEIGKFRYLGVSNFDTRLMDRVRRVCEIVSLQPHYSLLERSIEQEILPYCVRNKIGVLGYGSLAGGILTGKFKNPPSFEAGDQRADFYGFFKEPTFGKVRKLTAAIEEIAKELDKTVAQVVVNWTFSQKGVTSALVGARTPAQALQNAQAGDFSLSTEHLEAIDRAWKEAGLAG